MAEQSPEPQPPEPQSPEPQFPEPQSPRPQEPDPLASVVGALTDAGLDPGPTELADALWLARWSRPTTVRTGEPAEGAGPGGAGTGGGTHGAGLAGLTDPTPPGGTVLPRSLT